MPRPPGPAASEGTLQLSRSTQEDYPLEQNYEEVYDIEHYPYETDSLTVDPKYKMKLKELRIRYKELKKIHGVPEAIWNKTKTKF